MSDEQKLARIRWLAETWRAVPDYDVTPASDPRNPSEMDVAYDDAAMQILTILNDAERPQDVQFGTMSKEAFRKSWRGFLGLDGLT
jgi:hypothetical protein